MTTRSLLINALGLVCLLAATQVAADWLVTVDGERLETDGPWQVEGRRIMFTTPGGTLSVLRASEVDLEASEQATQQSLQPVASPEPEVRRPLPVPVLTLTNEDIPQAQLEEAPAVASTIADDPSAEPVQIVSWQETETRNGGGLAIRGIIRNSGNELASGIRISAEIKDADGEPLTTAQAQLDARSLLPGKTTSFKINLDGIFDLSVPPEFSISSAEINVGLSSLDGDVVAGATIRPRTIDDPGSDDSELFDDADDQIEDDDLDSQ